MNDQPGGHLVECGVSAEWGSATALFSADKTYRYVLTRCWDPALPTTAFVMLNPSTADALQLDPTVRRCLRYARAWGSGRLLVLNAFAVRGTRPRPLLYDHPDPIGPHNDQLIEAALAEHDPAQIVAAWGHHARRVGQRHLRMAEILGGRAVALRVTKDGDPGHPLYLPAAALPVPWAP